MVYSRCYDCVFRLTCLRVMSVGYCVMLYGVLFMFVSLLCVCEWCISCVRGCCLRCLGGNVWSRCACVVFVGVCSLLNMCVECDWLCDVVWCVSL